MSYTDNSENTCCNSALNVKPLDKEGLNELTQRLTTEINDISSVTLVSKDGKASVYQSCDCTDNNELQNLKLSFRSSNIRSTSYARCSDGSNCVCRVEEEVVNGQVRRTETKIYCF